MLSLDEIGYLGDIRQRFGAKDENDTSYDAYILKLSAFERLRSLCGWHLGSENWADQFKEYCESQGIYLTVDENADGILLD